jgi:hypothetical protein
MNQLSYLHVWLVYSQICAKSSCGWSPPKAESSYTWPPLWLHHKVPKTNTGLRHTWKECQESCRIVWKTLKNTEQQLKTIGNYESFLNYKIWEGMYISNGNHVQWFSSILSVSPLPISQIFNPIDPTFNWWQY